MRRNQRARHRSPRAESRSATVGCSFALTLSAQYKVGGFTLIPEVRFDSGSKDVFSEKDGMPKSSSANVLLAAIYKF